MELFFETIKTIGVVTIAGALIYFGRKLQTLDDLKATMEKVKINVQTISTYLTRHHAKFNANELQAFSPLRLTNAGEKLITDIGFDEILIKNKEDFFKFINSEGPGLKYDVETASIKSIYALYEKPYMSFLKTFFYNNPERNLENVAPTLGIYLRDKYLDQHPEIEE